MIVPHFDHDIDLVDDYTSGPQFLSGGMNPAAPPPREALLNPRAIGFGAHDALYIPIYVVAEDE